MKTADGVEIVVGMNLWWWDADELELHCANTAVISSPRYLWMQDAFASKKNAMLTRAAELRERAAELSAEAERLESDHA